MRAVQPDLFNQFTSKAEKREHKRRLTHGGVKSKGKRKLRRPLSTKKWMHLILKSDRAAGKYSMLSQRNSRWIDQLIRAKAKKFGVELKDFVNMGNHIHFQLRVVSRESFQNFLRSITNLIARYVTGARRGVRFGRFWQGLAFTRVITSFIELTQLDYYFTANKVEARRGYGSRQRYLDSANAYITSLRFRPKLA